MYTSFSNQVWKPRTSVKLRFALAQGFFIALIISLLALALYFPVKRRLVSITDNSYKILTNNLASGIYPDYTRGDKASVMSTIRRVEGQQGVKYVLLVDASNVVYYDSVSGAKSLEGTTLTDDLTTKVTNGDLVVGKMQREDTEYYAYVSPFLTGNTVTYTVRLAIDEAVIDGQFKQLARQFVSLGIAGIVIGIFTAYVLAAKLTKPIIKLTESALAIRAGNLNAYPDITTNDELEQLSREFQGMVEKLKGFYFKEYSQKKEAVNAKTRLEEINGRLEELDRQKTDFLNAASHQLRTPLSIIHWSLSLLVDEATHLNLKPDQSELLTESLKSTKRMVDLVNELLDLSRLEQGRKELTWKKANFGGLCEELVAALQPLANNKKLALTYEKIGEIPDSFLDPINFYQVINNFVDNSIKYTAEGWVKVTCEARDGEVLIKVSDSGIGMNEEERSRLFTRFSRGSEASKMFANGSGLGMFVAKTILDQHGGHIDIQSEKGHGTIFTLHAPLYDTEPGEVSVPTDEEATAAFAATPSAEELVEEKHA